jgi:hypothetical protein
MEPVKIEIVPVNLAIKAMMDSGYRNTAYALAELMDNSIQAGASEVELLCIEKVQQRAQRQRVQISEIGVLDNGSGMPESVMRLALQFGNGTRLDGDDPQGMGKFGMGLPSASISQARKVEVWSWQNGINSALYTYLDVDKIMRAEMDELPHPVKEAIPEHWRKVGRTFGHSGTLVVWTGLERCIWKTGKAVIKNSEFLIGRMYRKFLHSGQVTIRMATFDGGTKGYDCTLEEFAKPNDPLYLMGNTSTPKPFDEEPMFEPWPTKTNYEVPLNVRWGGETHKVYVRCSIVKRENRDDGTAGNTKSGNHAKKNIGVSIVRAGRELDLDASWASLGEVRHRWWGIEVEFPPALDEVFGVTNNKQYASHFAEMARLDLNEWLKESGKTWQELRDEADEDGDSKAALIEIAVYVRKQIDAMFSQIKSQRADQTRRRRHQLPVGPEIVATKKTRQRQDEGHLGVSDEGEKRDPLDRKAEIEGALTSNGITLVDAKEYATAAIDHSLKYIFVESPHDTPAFFSVQPKGGTLIITLNTNHAAFDRLVDVLERDIDNNVGVDEIRERLTNALDGLKLLLMAWARYEDEQQSPQAREKAQEARVDWGRMARRFLQPDN